MKYSVAILFLIISSFVIAQRIPHPLFLKIETSGKVVPVTADPYATSPRVEITSGTDSLDYDILSTCPNNGHIDSVRELRSAPAAGFDVSYRTDQRELSTLMFYPEIMEPSLGVFEMNLIDTLTTYNYTVDGFVCGNGGHYHYEIHEDWIYDENGSLKTVVTHSPYYSDTNSIVYHYEWTKSGKLSRVTVINSIFLYEEWERDTITMEMVFDSRDRLITQVAYKGSRMNSLSVSIKEWQGQLRNHSANSVLEIPKDHNGVELAYLITYNYENDLLRSALGYNAAYSIVISDTLEYNRKGEIIKYTTHSDDGYLEIAYAYNKKSQVISKTETQFYRDYEGGIRKDGELTETYSYDSKDRVSEVHYFWPDARYPNTVEAKIEYR